MRRRCRDARARVAGAAVAVRIHPTVMPTVDSVIDSCRCA